MHTPVISVHMPVYNAERYLAEAVESILAQTFPDFEFIIIDDGSTDGSPEILRRYADEDQRIRLVSRSNAGVAEARNEALRLARGEYFAVMDADDISLPQRFAEQVAYLRNSSDCIAVGSRVLLIDPDGIPIREWPYSASHEEIDGAHMEGKAGAVIHPSAMIRREPMLEAGGYWLRSAEDYDLFLRLAERGRLANLPQLLLKYRQHLKSFGYAQRNRQSEDARLALQQAQRRRGITVSGSTAGPDMRYASESDHHRKWAWWALGAGNVATARKHAWTAVRKSPFSLKSWHVAVCAARGR
ncbi:MAG: glycosyltransferase family 2 protein [Phycisphaerae bacterium]